MLDAATRRFIDSGAFPRRYVSFIQSESMKRGRAGVLYTINRSISGRRTWRASVLRRSSSSYPRRAYKTGQAWAG